MASSLPSSMTALDRPARGADAIEARDADETAAPASKEVMLREGSARAGAGDGIDVVAPGPSPAGPALTDPALVDPSLGEPSRREPAWPEVPDVVGMEVLDALHLLRQHGLRLLVSVWETKIGPWGMVLSQQPEPQSRVRRRSRVQVVVAGRPHLVVPDVCGLEIGAAMERLRRAGLRPARGRERVSRGVAPAHVVAMHPRAGTLVVDGSRVVLDVVRQPAAPGRPPA